MSNALTLLDLVEELDSIHKAILSKDNNIIVDRQSKFLFDYIADLVSAILNIK